MGRDTRKRPVLEHRTSGLLDSRTPMKANLSTEPESSVTTASTVPTTADVGVMTKAITHAPLKSSGGGLAAFSKQTEGTSLPCVNDEAWCPGTESDGLPCFDCFTARNQ